MGSHDYAAAPRNAAIRISINGGWLFARGEAEVPVCDAGHALGDGVRDGLRRHDSGYAPRRRTA